MGKEKVLFVDDDTNMLDTFRRILHHKYQVDTASTPIEAFQEMNKSGPYAVIVVDMKMPEMDGVHFLQKVKEMFPDTVRIMLTGHGDMQVSMEALNSGQIFRFLTKPCSQEDMTRALDDAIAQYRLITGEKELLEKTLTGTVQVLMEILSLTNEEAMGRASRIKRFVRDVALHMGEMDIWLYENAAMLSQIGCIILPESVLKKLRTGEKLEPEEFQHFNQHPFIAADMLRKVPRMEEISRIISYQEKHFDGGGVPVDKVEGRDIPLGARILKVTLDFDLYVVRGMKHKEALYKMVDKKNRYDPQVFKSFVEVLQAEEQYKVREVTVDKMVPFMVLLEKVVTLKGGMLLKEGNEISATIAEKLRKMDETYGVKQPIKVLIPPQKILEKKRAQLESSQVG